MENKNNSKPSSNPSNKIIDIGGKVKGSVPKMKNPPPPPPPKKK